MATLNPIVDLETPPITRQTLFDLWGTAELGTIQLDDLADDVVGIISADSAPSEAPGRIWHDTLRKRHYVYTDVHAGTGVSLWLAIGPDRLEVPCLCAEPIAAGAVVELWFDRWVKPAAPSEGALGDGVLRVLGGNQSGVAYPLNMQPSETAQSGSWIAVGIDGILSGFTRSGVTPPTQNFPLGVDHESGALGAASNKHTPGSGTARNPVVGYATWNNSIYSAAQQPNFAHYYDYIYCPPKRVQGPFAP